MAALSAGSVTYTLNNLRRGGNSKVMNNVKLAFGDGSSTYPTGGIPITIGNLGCPNNVESMVIADHGSSGYLFRYDQVNKKLLMLQGALHNHQILLKNGAQTSAANNSVMAAASNKFGANTGADIIVAGVTSTTAANGGIVSDQAATVYTEIASTSTPAALTLIVEVVGW